MDLFRSKTALITGAGSGIGRALALALAGRGATVVVTDISAERAKDTAAAIAAQGGKAQAATLDVTDAFAVQGAVERAEREHGLDMLFNNAGIAVIGAAVDNTLDDWNRTIDINLKGVVHGVHAAYPLFAKKRAGYLVNIASLAGLIPAPGLTAYAATKHGVVGLSVSLRAEAAAYGVKVSAVCPGFIDTRIFTDSKYLSGDVEAQAGKAKKLSVSAEDCARAVLRGMQKNQAIIPVTGHAKAMWILNRYAQSAMHLLARVSSNQIAKVKDPV